MTKKTVPTLPKNAYFNKKPLIELFRTKPIDPSLPAEEWKNLPNSSIQALKMGNYANL